MSQTSTSNSWSSKNEWAMKEGTVCTDLVYPAAEVGRDIRRKLIKRWKEGIHGVTVGADEQHPRGLDSVSTSAMKMLTISQNNFFSASLSFSVHTSTADELVGRWASLRVTINSLFQTAHLYMPGA